MQIKIKHLKKKLITIFTTNNVNVLFFVDGFVVLQNPTPSFIPQYLPINTSVVPLKLP